MEYTEKLHQQFGGDKGWGKYFRKFIESPDMDELFRYIKQRAQTGAKILPASDNVFRCFRETEPDNLHAIIAGIAPYHTTYGKDKEIIADGLALSCSTTWRAKGLQPSLEQIYGSWEHDYNDSIDVDMEMDGDLSYLAKSGVLLYNVALTVEENKPLSMNCAWEKFNKYMWSEVISKYFRGLPIIMMGTQSQKSAIWLTPMLHHQIWVSHPASGSYQGVQWKSEGCWKTVDDILTKNNGEKIQWYKKKANKPEQPIPDWVTHKMDGTAHQINDMPWD